jgi:hypothetical protein
MTEADFFDENCENCAYLTNEDACGNPRSVYHLRPMVYRDGTEVLQTGWCDHWAAVRAEKGQNDL